MADNPFADLIPAAMTADANPFADLIPGKGPNGKELHKASFKQIDDVVRAIANGATFGLADRLAAKAGDVTGIGGKQGDYAGNLANEQARTDEFKTDNPAAAISANIAGGAAVPLGLIGAGIKGASLGAKTLYGAALGGGVGAIGGAAGSKDWTDLPQVGKDTLVGGGTGMVLGGLIPGASAVIGKGYNAIANALTRTDGISRQASKPLIEALKADGPAAVRSNLDRYGNDAMLVDSGPAMLGKGQGAAGNSDEARSIMQTNLTGRNEGTNARIQSDVNRALGPAEDPQTVTNAIRANRAEVDARNYPAALDSAPAVQVAPILTELDHRIAQTPVGSMEHRALTNARAMLMTTERRPLLDAAGYPQYDHLGHQRWTEVPVSQNDASILHRVKGELDNIIQYDAPGLGVPAGALQRQQGALRRTRGAINAALEEQVPGYAEANRASAALAQRGEAVQTGTQYLGSGKTTPSPDRFAAEFDPLSQGEKIALAKGSRGEIERVLGTKANDLQALRGELQGEGGWNTAKIATVHGQDAADELMASVDRNLKFRDTHTKIVEGSQTDLRNQARKAMKPDPSTETPLLNPNMTLTGLAGTIGKKAVSGIADALLKRDPTAAYGEVARVLTAQGSQRDAHFQALVEALRRRQSNEAMASKVGDNAALAAALLGAGAARRTFSPQDKSE